MACAKCHDHKFAPIPTQDYSELAGIFLSTEPLYGTIQQKYSNNPTDLLPIGPNGASLHAAFAAHEKKIVTAEKPWKAKQEELKKAEEAEKGLTGKSDTNEKKKAAQDQIAKLKIAKLKEELAPLQTAVEELKKGRPPQPPYAMSARDRAKPADTKIAIRGDYRKPGNSVPRGFLTALEIPDTPAIDPQHSGRLELARWLTSNHNPLTARVIVNRIWYHLLGRGLVESVDNFGLMGKEPSHPELLDSLAVQFMHEGWSVKQMIRAIVLSRTYQLSCQVDEANMQLDPDNRQLWRSTPRRLSVEAIRDAILAVSGQLDLDPPKSSSVTDLGDQMVRGVALEKLQPANNHRSIYLPVVRDYLPDLFDRFDFPSPSLVSGHRGATNVPAQALYLRNSPFVTEQALHAARRLLASGGETEDKSGAESTVNRAAVNEARIDKVMRWVLARPATDLERQAALALILPILNAEPAIDNGAEALIVTWAGGGFVPLVQAANDLGVTDEIPIAAGFVDNVVMPAFFADSIGTTSGILYHYTMADNEINDWLVEQSTDRFGVPPDLFDADAMNAAILIGEALKATGGDASASVLIGVLEGMEFEGPKGIIFIRPEDHVALQDMYIAVLLNVDDPEFKYYEYVETNRPEVPCLLPDALQDRCGDIPVGSLSGE